MLIEYLHLVQDANGHISSNLMEALSNEMKLPLVEVWEVASFYDHFDLIKDNETPPPKKTIRVFPFHELYWPSDTKAAVRGTRNWPTFSARNLRLFSCKLILIVLP